MVEKEHTHMKFSLRNILINIGVTFVTLLLCALFFEFVIFKYILKASDYPALATGENVTRFQPEQKGVFRIQDEIAASFSINENGWNSGKDTYLTTKAKPRILIIGDSYLSALQVDFDKSLAEQLEALGQGQYEVYRIGIDGAPLSQYLHMLREEALRYKPDLVIFNLVHNDFTESYQTTPGVYTDSFMHLKINEGRVVDEIPPVPFFPKWYSPIRSSNTWQYLALRRQMRFQFLRDALLSQSQTKTTPQYQGNIDVSTLKQATDINLVATEYILRQAKAVCEQNGAQFMVVMDGVRSLIYRDPNGPYDRTKGALQLNAVVEEAAKETGVPVVDMHAIFARHYRAFHQKFEFQHDGHWNELGHEIAAQAIYDDLNARNAFPKQ